MDEDFVENTENDKVIALEEIALQHSFVGRYELYLDYFLGTLFLRFFYQV